MCKKRCFSKAEASDLVYTARWYRKHKRAKRRKERRFYWCEECNAFHVTSQTYHHDRSKWVDYSVEGKMPVSLNNLEFA